MKAIKKSIRCSFILIASIIAAQGVFAQKVSPEQEVAIKNLLDSHRYVFHAITVTPLAGGERQLPLIYTVAVYKDSIVSDLPFFGQAYTAPTINTFEGIKFSSTRFDYKLTQRKKGGWDISIWPKDIHDSQHLKFGVYKDGSVYLFVTNTNRQSIAFNGYISE
jgi:hypothetical protein